MRSLARSVRPALSAALTPAVQVFLYPSLSERYGSVRVLQLFAAPGYLVLPFLWPIAALLARADRSLASDIVFYVAMVLWSWANCSFNSASRAARSSLFQA